MKKTSINPSQKRLSNICKIYSFDLEEFPGFIEIITHERYNQILNLIKEYNLEEYQDDLLLLSMKIRGFPVNDSNDNIFDWISEMLNVSMFLKKHKTSDIKIVFKHKKLNENATLSFGYNVAKIREYFTEKFSTRNEEKDFEVLKKLNKKSSGRKPKHQNLGLFIHVLKKYLQENTCMKAKKGVNISNKQIKFIHSFLDYLGISNIPKSSYYETDYIRQYYTRYLKKLL